MDLSEVRNLPIQRREAALQPSTFNAAERTVEVVWTTGARVMRMDWWTGQRYEEELVVSSAAVDMSRLANGAAPVLNTHSSGRLEDQLGVVVRAWIDGNEGRALLRLSERPEVSGIVADIQSGVIRNISVGYSVRKYEITPADQRKDGGKVPLYRAVDWTPAELSFVPIPADASAQTRASEESSQPCEFVRATPSTTEQSMDVQNAGAQPEVNVADAQRQAAEAERARAAEIIALCQRHAMPEIATQAIAAGTSVDQVRSQILDKLATADEQTGGQRNLDARVTRDEAATRMAGIAQAIEHRMNPSAQLDDNGRQYRGLSLIELGRDFLEGNGISTRGRSRLEVAGMILSPMARAAGMHTVSDFPSLMANVANKRLRAAYDENPGTYAMWARRAPNAPDFKSIQVTALSGAPDLQQVNEHGEFRYGTMADGKETYNVVTAGRIVALTRQAIINDDLRAFDRLVTAFGTAARRYENATVYGILTGNAALADGVALFSTTSGARTQSNVTTGSGSALQLSALAASRAAMRLMKGLQGEALNIVPRFLIVPATLEQTALQLTSANYVAAQPSNINEFRAGGRTALEPIVEPILDANSTAYWYLAADSGQIDTVEYCYLDGYEGAVIEQDVGFEIDGVQLKCRLDFAAKAIDYRGLHRAAGA